MGTNFYLHTKSISNESERGAHIGKRSAAGLYCWDCGLTLCINGTNGVHRGNSRWYKTCPHCGGERQNADDLTQGAAARELGFDKSPFARGVGVATCSSFSWAISPTDPSYLTVTAMCKDGVVAIVDEYGRQYSADEFKRLLEKCPIQFFGSIGETFS